MARPDTLLTGSIMAMIAVALLFDDGENGQQPPVAGGEPQEPDVPEESPDS